MLKEPQRGQALVFSLLFLSVVVLSLLILYNQGQLVSSRVQIENTADATAYSVAKLAARHQNFVAYTNRAMIANEVSIGQIAGLVSWSDRYRSIPQWLSSFPAYQITIGPTPVTIAQVLRVLFFPYELLGRISYPVVSTVAKKYPVGVTFTNTMLGGFQMLFAVATLESQYEAAGKIVQLHGKPGESGDQAPYIPRIGYFLLTQNTVLSYWGDNFSAENLYNQARTAAGATGDVSDPEQLVTDFLGDEVGLSAESMYNFNNPAEMSDDDVKGEYERFAALVNEDRDKFSSGRHFEIFPRTPPLQLPPIPLLLVTVELTVGIGAGFKSDGGAAYRFNEFTPPGGDASEALGWSSLDFTSLGVEILFEVEVCDIFGLLGCFDVGGVIPISFPVGGASYQYVSEQQEAMRAMLQWGFPLQNLFGFPDIYGSAFSDPFHTLAQLWGSAVPPVGIYGLDPNMVNIKYGGAPRFMSLGESFRESGKSYEFAVAVAKRTESIKTTDNPDGLGIQSDLFEVNTRSAAEGDTLLEFFWEDEKPLMTVSSAETYFARRGSDEKASLFSPFWDARLRETSPIIEMIASNQIDPNALIPDVSAGGAARFIVEWALDKAKDEMVDSIENYVGDKVDPPLDRPAKELVRKTAGDLLDAGSDQLLETIDIENW